MNRKLHVIDAGRQRYAETLALQEQLVEQRVRDEIPDTLVYVEHEPVYTLGRNANAAHILLGREELQRRGIDVHETGRGGDVTYHGPGQLVGYPIMRLRMPDEGPVWFVGGLEDALISTLGRFDLQAGTDPINHGAWVGPDKIAAIGVRITRATTMHGFALNICTDLSHYAGIVPCGIRERGVTSMAACGCAAGLEDVKPVFLECFMKRFSYDSSTLIAGGDAPGNVL